ncbi:kynureninase [Sphingomonas nostoxanthinifaciens]|uniref:kynureninase n=1 Tax=Sphingomonas nostoxanthinifaciens TaxID=2872652 RepID=UPI001CC1F47B|nr:kynureninase [Sphingomonas nostoxanthinifaciens]UAK26238.1 kynureninase [Sphingomonas nostoxanthinifaciens]
MTTLDEARDWDATDPLRKFRARFALPDGIIYLDGNSLGALPHATAARLGDAVAREWGEGLIRSWNDAGWAEAPRRVGAKIARLIGAAEDEVVVADSTSVNLYKLLMAAAADRDGAIVVEADGFPTDAYVARAVATQLSRPFRVIPAADLAGAFTDDVSAAVVTHVDYRTAARHDLAALTGAARAQGARIVWDLSHSVGAVPLDLGRDGVELAVGCGYKYLNGGPGAPAFLYVARHLQARLASPIAGWWGHAAPFDFTADFRPSIDIGRFQAGTPPVLGLLALEIGVDLMLEADRHAIWAKACRLYDLFAERLRACCPGLALIGPTDAGQRGSHAAFRHPHAVEIVRAAIAKGVIGDFRTPDIARFGLTPLTLRYEDIWQAVEILGETIASEAWRDERFARGGVVT